MEERVSHAGKTTNFYADAETVRILEEKFPDSRKRGRKGKKSQWICGLITKAYRKERGDE